MNQSAADKRAKAPKAPLTQGATSDTHPFGQTVLVLQGGGALGAYQAGVYQAMHEGGIEPDWVVGTSIGAINGVLIAGNPVALRMERLRAFWAKVELNDGSPLGGMMEVFGNAVTNMTTVLRGIPGFFTPNLAALCGPQARVGIDHAAWYSTAPLRANLLALVDFDFLQSQRPRLTVGAVNANTGAMRYFDSRHTALTVDHILASGALPPAFPAVRIDGAPYWDGGIYSNTPMEVVMDETPRRDSTIVTVQLWNPEGEEANSLAQVDERQKEIQYSSRDNSHIARQQQIHKLRHVIRELGGKLTAAQREQPAMKELCAWGCGTTMHVVRLLGPRLDGENQSKDIDFTSRGIHARWQAGYRDMQRVIAAAPWQKKVDPADGVVIHDFKHEAA